MSVEARDAYFKLARALTRASLAKTLKVPTFPDNAEDISIEKVRGYQDKIKQNLDLDDVENVGETRARAVKEGLARLAETSILERYI